MKKIAIITLHDVNNYGSVLQTYATQCYFEDMGMDPIIIDYRRPWETRFGYWFYMNEKNLMGLVRNIVYFPTKIIQRGVFQRFRKVHLKLTAQTYSNEKELKKNPIEADFFCTGSDQVWNSGWNEGVIPAYFLNFVEKKALKFSFAASFGSSRISTQDANKIKYYLETYELVTVREKQSVDMLRDDLKIQAVEILDPTLQIEGEFWKSLCRPERYLREKYVLLIQLNRNKTFDNLAVCFAKKHKMRLVRLCLRVDQLILNGKCILIPEVEDYIRLIRDAEYVLTDSFHAVSFCLNLEKQFYVYYPEKYSERLKSILSIVNLKDRELQSLEKEADIDYKKVQEIIKNKRIHDRNIITGMVVSQKTPQSNS